MDEIFWTGIAGLLAIRILLQSKQTRGRTTVCIGAWMIIIAAVLNLAFEIAEFI